MSTARYDGRVPEPPYSTTDEEGQYDDLSRSGCWQPIETAPKDGSHFIGRDGHGAREMWGRKDYYEGEFWQDHQDSEPAPTHWYPMPF
jgi:hypothetical protein